MTVRPSIGPELGSVLEELTALRERSRSRRAESKARAFPSAAQLEQAVALLSEGLFPRRLGRFAGSDDGEQAFVAARITDALALLEGEIAAETDYWEEESPAAFDPDHSSTIVRHFLPSLPQIRSLIESDVEAGFLGDPAARTADEILVCYPGALALLHHRIAHPLFNLGAPITARMISELANARTGIDIHPGAKIGPSFFIDHGTGVVVGETAKIGSNVRLYQHVTLGAPAPLGAVRLSPRTRHARHPIVEDDVTVYAGATILGPVTIGRGSTIGANVWIEQDVPPGSLLLQAPAQLLSPSEVVSRTKRVLA